MHAARCQAARPGHALLAPTVQDAVAHFRTLHSDPHLQRQGGHPREQVCSTGTHAVQPRVHLVPWAPCMARGASQQSSCVAGPIRHDLRYGQSKQREEQSASGRRRQTSSHSRKKLACRCTQEPGHPGCTPAHQVQQMLGDGPQPRGALLRHQLRQAAYRRRGWAQGAGRTASGGRLLLDVRQNRYQRPCPTPPRPTSCCPLAIASVQQCRERERAGQGAAVLTWHRAPSSAPA